jgi:2-oxoglutarate ferredoxin oxidoreductase subunit gamma
MKKNNEKIMKSEIRLSGSGGQGLITAGIILAKAAAHEKMRVMQSQSYGPESRGGASRADVIISNSKFYHPEATNFDILLSLNQESCDKYSAHLKEDGILIADSASVKNIGFLEAKIYEVPFTDICQEKLGTILPTNIMSLAFMVKLTNIVSGASLRKAVEETVKERFLEMNNKAIKIGFKLAEDYKKKQ